MANQYETYLKRLRGLKLERPEMKIYERNIQGMATPFNQMNRQTAAITKRGGASTAAQAAALQEGRDQWNQQQNAAYTTALGQMSQRNESIDMKIAEVEAQNVAFKEQEQKEANAKKAQNIRTGLQVAGLVVGGALAIPTGGMSLMAGAAIGAGIGQAAGGFVGVNESGEISLDPENWDMGQTVQGLSSAATAYAYDANQQDTKAKMAIMGAGAAKFNDYLMAHPEQAESLRFQTQTIFANGTAADLENLYNGLVLEAPAAGGQQVQAPGSEVSIATNTNTAPVEGLDTPAPAGPGQIALSAAEQETLRQFSVPDKTAFSKAVTSANAKPAYSRMYDTMIANGWSYDSPEMEAWVKKNYPVSGTYGKFVRLYEAAQGGA